MKATFIQSDGTERRVFIRLTKAEMRHYRNAHLASWLLFWKTPADLMGPELEAIVCGHEPERYVDQEWPE